MSSDLDRDWPADEPPPGFAERVVAAAMRERRAVARRRVTGASIAALAIAAGLAVVFLHKPPSSGDVRAEQRTEVAIGSRAVAVLEPGAHVAWDGDVVKQDAGDVFYRVEPGSTFRVHTPAADVDVLGTCFHVKVEEDAMNRRDLAAGAVGAGLSAIALVGVYEGKVKVAHDEQSVVIGAGHTARADDRGVRDATRSTSVGDKARSASSANDDNGTLARTAADLKAKLAEVEAHKKQLEKQLAAAEGSKAKNPYDLSADDWAALAKQGAVKYQMPCTLDGGFRPSAAQLDRLGLAPPDADAIQTAYQHANDRFGRQVLRICADAFGGEAAAESLGVKACIRQIMSNAQRGGPDGARKTFTEVAEIRAGQHAEPADGQGAPELRLLLAMTGQMKAFEGDLAEAFGPEEAHRIASADDLCFTYGDVDSDREIERGSLK